MGLAGSASALAMLLLFTAWTPWAAAGNPLEDCTTVRYAITEDTGGIVRFCPEGPEDPGDPQPPVPGVPVEDLPSLGWLIEGAVPDLPVDWPDLPWGLGPGQPAHVQTRNCNEGFGTWLVINDKPSFACVIIDFWIDPVDQQVPDVSPGSPELVTCPGNDTGYILQIGNVKLGACAIYDWRIPNPDGDAEPFIDTTSCSVSAGDGADPEIGVWDGGVAFCVAPIIMIGPPDEPDEPPEYGVDLSPCSRHGVDPAVMLGDQGVFICIEFMIDP